MMQETNTKKEYRNALITLLIICLGFSIASLCGYLVVHSILFFVVTLVPVAYFFGAFVMLYSVKNKLRLT